MISSIFVQRMDWHGMIIEITYEPNWMGGFSEAYGEPLAHLQIRSVSPVRAALPVTETGYRSAFLPGSLITAEGGPVSFVRNWLDGAAGDPAWKHTQEQARQFSLFSDALVEGC